MSASFYGIEVSHPSQAARAMLDLKGIDYKPVWLLPGFQAIQLRAFGFRGRTVPAIKLDGRRVQTTRAISRALDEAKPEPPLFPADPGQRVRVEDAERWGEQVLQPLPRQVFRWAGAHSQEVRASIAKDAGVPAPALAARVNAPVARLLSRQAEHEGDGSVKQGIARLPQRLDRVDELIAEGVIGGERPNAADFQIASTIASLLSFDEFIPAIENRPAAELARRLFPEFPGRLPAGHLPAEWLAPLGSG